MTYCDLFLLSYIQRYNLQNCIADMHLDKCLVVVHTIMIIIFFSFMVQPLNFKVEHASSFQRTNARFFHLKNLCFVS